MTKPELGVRRRCLTCSGAFYDLNRSPITCVKCGALFSIVELPRSPARRAAVQMNAAESIVPVASGEGDLVLPDGDEADDEAGEESTLPPLDEDEDEVGLDEIVTIPSDDKATDS